MAGKQTGPNDLMAALAFPLRRQVLRRMRDETKPISPIELASEFQKPLSTVAYHLRVLASCGAVRLVGTEPVRGSVKHLYRISLKQVWAQQIIDLEPWDARSNRPRGARKSHAG